MPVTAPVHILPPRLDALLAALTDAVREPVIIRGWSRECVDNEHQFARWISGHYSPPVPAQMARAFPGVPGPVLDLVLYVCTNCEGLEVRDRTVDLIDDFDGRGGRKLIATGRRDGFLGWYSGARSNQRQYIGGTSHA